MYSENLINAFKTVLACLLGILTADLFKFESKQWLIVTIIVVMSTQIHLGGVLKKVCIRFSGTLAGIFIAGITLIFVKHNSLIINSVGILSIFVFTYLSAVFPAAGEAGKLGSVTITLTLLSNNPDLHITAIRLLEISWGLVIALGVAVLVFPSSAEKKLKILLAENLRVLKNYYHASVNADKKHCQKLEETVMNNFLRAKNLFEEAITESKTNKHYYLAVLLHEKRLFRSVSLLEGYLITNPSCKENFKQAYPLLEDNLEKLYLRILDNNNTQTIIHNINRNNVNNADKFLGYFIFKEIRLLIKTTEKNR